MLISKQKEMHALCDYLTQGEMPEDTRLMIIKMIQKDQ